MPVFTIRIERSAAPATTGRRRRPRPRVLVVLAATVVAVLAAAGLAEAVGPISSAKSVYTAIAPLTVLHGRILNANGVVTPVVAGGTGPVPASATSVMVGVEVSAGTTKGSLYVYPTGGAAVRAMRWTVGQAETQQLTVPVGSGHKITIKNLTGKVTVTMRLLGYYAPPDVPTTYTTSPTSAKFLWNSQYVFETGIGSYTEYFTRYDNVSVPALTQSVLNSGSVQVFFTPSPVNNPGSWLPLPYQFDSSFGFTFNFTYVTSPGHVVLMFYFIQTDPNATLPTLSTYAMSTYNFKIVITPNSAGGHAAAAAPQVAQGQATCTPIPGGKACTVRR